MKILIAEDDVDISKLYKVVLEKNHHIVSLANDGEKALDLYIQDLENTASKNGEKYTSSFDIVLLDYEMPKKNGLDVAKEILEFVPNQKIVFASGFVESTLKEAIEVLKHNQEIIYIPFLIQKPFEMETLLQTIDNFNDPNFNKMLTDIWTNIKKSETRNDHEILKNIINTLKKYDKKSTTT